MHDEVLLFIYRLLNCIAKSRCCRVPYMFSGNRTSARISGPMKRISCLHNHLELIWAPWGFRLVITVAALFPFCLFFGEQITVDCRMYSLQHQQKKPSRTSYARPTNIGIGENRNLRIIFSQYKNCVNIIKYDIPLSHILNFRISNDYNIL